MRAAGGGGGTKTRPMDAEFQRYMDRLRSAVRLSDYLRRSLRLERRGREWAALCPFHEGEDALLLCQRREEFLPLLRLRGPRGRHRFPHAARGAALHRGGWSGWERKSGLGPPPRRKPASPEAEREQDERVRLGAMLEEAAGVVLGPPLRAGRARGARLSARGARRRRGDGGGLPPRPRPGGGGSRAERKKAAGKAAGSSPTSEHGAGASGIRSQAGLARRGEDGDVTPFFRRRIIFPIEDRRGKIVSFGGRALSPRARAKYLNGPETALFAKKRTLYNFPRAAEALRRAAVRPGQGGTGTADTAGRRQRSRLCAALRRGGLHGRAVALFEAGVETAVAPPRHRAWRGAARPPLARSRRAGALL